MEIIFSGLTDVGKARSRNEDYIGHAETLNGSLFIVCDGMGGHAGGDVASKTAVEAITAVFNRNITIDIPNLILQSFLVANETLFKLSSANPELSGMGTTVVLLLVRNKEIYYGNLGDSRLYHFNGSDLIKLSKDHSFVQQLVDKGIISEAEAEIHPRRNEITQALGIGTVIEPDICEAGFPVHDGDIFMLCSDGLYGMVNDKKMISILRNKENTLNSRCTELIENANHAGGNDNISVQLIEILKTGENAPTENHKGKEVKYGKTKIRGKIFVAVIIVVIILAGIILITRAVIKHNPLNIQDSISSDTAKPITGAQNQKTGNDSINMDTRNKSGSNQVSFKEIGKGNKSLKPKGPEKSSIQQPKQKSIKDTASKAGKP